MKAVIAKRLNEIFTLPQKMSRKICKSQQGSRQLHHGLESGDAKNQVVMRDKKGVWGGCDTCFQNQDAL